jgi:hypothetical protein
MICLLRPTSIIVLILTRPIGAPRRSGGSLRGIAGNDRAKVGPMTLPSLEQNQTQADERDKKKNTLE